MRRRQSQFISDLVTAIVVRWREFNNPSPFNSHLINRIQVGREYMADNPPESRPRVCDKKNDRATRRLLGTQNRACELTGTKCRLGTTTGLQDHRTTEPRTMRDYTKIDAWKLADDLT